MHTKIITHSLRQLPLSRMCITGAFYMMRKHGTHTRVEEPRLTQVFFVNALAVKERIPSERVLSYVI